jgi:hypothetical protein
VRVTFRDFGIEKKPERVFDSKPELASFMDSLRAEPMMCELLSENGFKLQIGIDDKIGCAQYCNADDDPPYWMAVSPSIVVSENHDFPMTGDATEVDKAHCLPIEILKEITGYFLETGTRSSLVAWEEV